MLISYRLSIVTIALSETIRDSAAMHAIYHRMFPTLKSRGVRHFWAKFGRKVWCKPNFTTIWERDWAVICKRIVLMFCRLSTMHERDTQTEKQTDHGTVTSIRIGEIAFQWCRLIICELYPVVCGWRCGCWQARRCTGLTLSEVSLSRLRWTAVVVPCWLTSDALRWPTTSRQ